jgi:hypothetical protein
MRDILLSSGLCLAYISGLHMGAISVVWIYDLGRVAGEEDVQN